MAIHENLKPSDQELPLLLAGKALTGVRSLASRPTGTISVENPDGTSTIIGAGGDGPDGIAQQVGKTSQPGTPTGLSVSATGLTVSLMWDGTSDGIEENAGLAATLTDESGTSIQMGEIPGAGTLVATATVPGLAHVTARTYDNAHDTDGNPSRNLSQPVILDIVLSEIVDSQAIDDQMKQVNKTLDDNRQALDQANTDLADARKRLADHDQRIQQADKTLDDNRQALDQTNTELQNASKLIDDTKSQLAQTNASLRSAEDRIDSNTQGIADVSSELDTAKQRLDDNDRTLAQARKDLKDNADAVSAANKRIQGNSDALSKAQKAAQDAADSAATALSTANNASKTAGEAKTIAGDAQDAASKASSAASNAQTIAGQAQDTAGEAKTAASDAQKTAGEAKSAADNAASNASAALVDANSALAKAKNITFQKSAPTNPSKGDVWYPLDDSGHAIGMRTWDGVNWDDVTLVAGKLIVPGSIGSTLIADGAVTAPKITAGAVTADKLAANAVTADKLAANSVSADKLAANSVTADKIAANSVTADKLGANSVTAGKLAAGSVDASKLTADSVTSAKIVSGAVTADKLAANSVSADKLAANSVTADKIAANSVMADKIAAEAITGDKIAANSISTSKLTISAGNLFSNPTFAGDASRFGSTDRVDNVTFPDGSTGSTVAIKMDVTGMNPNVCDSEWIPCNRGDVFYVGVWLSYADDSYSVPQGKALYLGLDTRGDSSESWPTYGAPGLTIDTSEVPRNGGTGDKWKYFHTYVPCPATGVTRFWLDTYTNSHGFHLLVWRPTVIRAADAKLIVNGSITADKIAANSIGTDQLEANAVTASKIAAGSIDADKIQGNRLIGTEIQTGDGAYGPYMLLTGGNDPNFGGHAYGMLQFHKTDDQTWGGLEFTTDYASAAQPSDVVSAYMHLDNPDHATDANHVNQIVMSDQTGTGNDERNILIASKQLNVVVNEGDADRTYSFTRWGVSTPETGYYWAHRNLFSRSDDDAISNDDGEMLRLSTPHVDDYSALDFQYVMDSENVHGSQRFYKPSSGTWVGFRFVLSLNYIGTFNRMYTNALMMQIRDQSSINTFQLPDGTWSVGQWPSDGKVQHKNIMWVTRVDGWKG